MIHSICDDLDKAGSSLEPGFVTAIIGRRGAVICALAIDAATGGNLGVLFALAVLVACNAKNPAIGMPLAVLMPLTIALSMVGLWGIRRTLRKMAERKSIDAP